MTAIIHRAELRHHDGAGDDWRHRSRCRDEDEELFFPVQEVVTRTTRDDGTVVRTVAEVEPPYPSPEVKAICDRCPVRPECLKYALDNHIEFGVFGGQTGYQRGQLLRRRSRQRCPGCGSDEVMTLGRDQVCVACGISWDVAVPLDDDV